MSAKTVTPLIRKMNLNKGCIEMEELVVEKQKEGKMNLNKGCIEIGTTVTHTFASGQMNLNKGCIEIPVFSAFCCFQFR